MTMTGAEDSHRIVTYVKREMARQTLLQRRNRSLLAAMGFGRAKM
jgi:hypothetical protein